MERFEFAIIMIVATLTGFILWYFTAIYNINFSIPFWAFVLLNSASIGLTLRRHFRRKAETMSNDRNEITNESSNGD